MKDKNLYSKVQLKTWSKEKDLFFISRFLGKELIERICIKGSEIESIYKQYQQKKGG